MTNKVPHWATEPIQNYLNYAAQLDRVLDLCAHGISLVRFIPNTIEVLRDTAAADAQQEYTDDDLQHAKDEEALAQAELSKGFPLLHAQWTVTLWSSLESFMRSFLVAWIENTPGAKTCDEFGQVRVRLSEYESLTGQERAYYLLDALEDSLQTRRMPGVARFERLLEAFDLGSPLASQLKDTLYELHQVRNALVHNQGIVDRRLATSCPWLDLTVGQSIEIRHHQYERYYYAVGEYVLELIQRLRVSYGLERYSQATDARTAGDTIA